jgi:uncharacterized protein YdeI (YjbR/CyaY-like superfamily)
VPRGLWPGQPFRAGRGTEAHATVQRTALALLRHTPCDARRRFRHPTRLLPHTTSDGLWLKIAKRGANEPGVTYPEAVEIALCWGWIDGQKKGLDDQHFLQRFTPRRARSIWSKINVDKVAALIEAGRMQAPGYAQIEAAKADGRWARAYDGARTSALPEDLLAALEGEPSAKAFFATINAANRYAVLWRIQTAVKPETRAKRIAGWWRCWRAARPSTSSSPVPRHDRGECRTLSSRGLRA